MQKYVLVCPFNFLPDKPVMLIRKAKPEWQKGRLNLVGGKVEPGEEFIDAAIREFREETGLDGINFRLDGTITSERSDFIIEVFSCYVRDGGRGIVSEPGEPVSWYHWDEVREDPALMENLKTVIPLIKAGMRDWSLVHDYHEGNRDACRIEWGTVYAAV